VEVVRIAPGLWRWTGYHEEWKENDGSVYCETPDGVVLIDPLLPPEDTARFWRALDRDVARAGDPVHVLVTVFWHTRSAAAMVERYSARVWAPSRGRGAIERRAGTVTDVFRSGDELPGSIVAFGTARAAEVVFWLPQHRSLVPGDVLLGDGKGGIRMCPRSWLPEKTSPTDLATSLAPLLDLPVQRVLLSHGEPVLSDGKQKLARALEAGSR
jgi:glyoxylase-like metal-dependent hydrolase (beta-lactamase superfamily II)